MKERMCRWVRTNCHAVLLEGMQWGRQFSEQNSDGPHLDIALTNFI
jgi:hypothetical protein